MANEYKKITGILMTVFGSFSIIFGLIGFSIEFSNPNEDLIVGILLGIFFIGLGFGLCFFGIKRFILSQKCNRLAKYVNTLGITSFYNLSQKMNTNMDKLHIYISESLARNLINGYVDYESQKIILNNDKRNIMHTPSQDKTNYSRGLVIKCKNCGAENTIINNQISNCEYCGSPLNQ